MEDDFPHDTFVETPLESTKQSLVSSINILFQPYLCRLQQVMFNSLQVSQDDDNDESYLNSRKRKSSECDNSEEVDFQPITKRSTSFVRI